MLSEFCFLFIRAYKLLAEAAELNHTKAMERVSHEFMVAF